MNAPYLNDLIDKIYDDGFYILDDFLDAQHYQALQLLHQTLYEAGSFKPANIGQHLQKNHNTTIRNDMICWIDKFNPHEAIQAYFTKLEEIKQVLNQNLFLGLMEEEAHFALYQSQNYYKKHVDQFTTNKDRRISCVYYLNAQWSPDLGGELKLYDKTSEELLSSITPLGNRFVCFNSNLPHEVTTAYAARCSIAAWLKIRTIPMID